MQKVKPTEGRLPTAVDEAFRLLGDALMLFGAIAAYRQTILSRCVVLARLAELLVRVEQLRTAVATAQVEEGGKPCVANP